MDFPNVWERICVQMQTTTWHWWSVHERAVEALVWQEVARLQPHEVLSLWFTTNDGLDWYFDNTDCGSLPAINEEIRQQVSDTITHQVLSHACDWENRRVFEYVHSPFRYD